MLHPPKGIQLANNVTELTAIAPLKPGGAEYLRRIFIQKKDDEKKGLPGPIAVIESIHYARWVILDGGTRLLFTSNYDGNFEDYMTEFAERDEVPLNAVFSQCEGWPGARPVGPFIQYVQKHMVPSDYYYSAYPRYTVKEVKRALYWKKETETVISDLLPELSDMVQRVIECCKGNAAANKRLASHNVTDRELEGMRKKIRTFLQTLAMPTPKDFGKRRH